MMNVRDMIAVLLLVILTTTVYAEQTITPPDAAITPVVQSQAADRPSALDERLADERAIRETHFSLITYKPNYMVLSYSSHQNELVEALDAAELKFQISFKANIVDDVFGGVLVFGYTQQSYWQAFNTEISSSFRETDYEPEIMWVFTRPRQADSLVTREIVVGFSHHSNGGNQPQSRSWNRLYVNFITEYDDFYLSFKPWYRIPEPEKTYPADPTGDDNPDISRYMGAFELTAIWARHDHQRIGLMLRNNLIFSDNRGAVQIDWSYPIKSKLKGYVQYFNGYGESLSDYNYSVSRLSVGLMLNNWL